MGYHWDRISNLPDSLIIHILSFLPIKNAIATSLLSNRWTSLWRYLPKLKFNDSSFQLVDTTLLLVDLKHVDTFVLNCKRVSVPNFKLHIWLKALLSHNYIAHLELQFHQPRVCLPSCVFKSKSITVLKLTHVKVSKLATVNLPSLVDLMLKSVEFSSSGCLQLLLSHCPHLQVLVVRSLDIPHLDLPLHIERFEHLLEAKVPTSLFSISAFSNVKSLILKQVLTSLDFPTFPNLIFLAFSVAHINWSTVSFLQSFPKLQRLLVISCVCKLFDFDLYSACILFIDEFLKPYICAHLCGQFLAHLPNNGEEDGEGLMEVAIPEVPPCVSSTLEEFDFIHFKGSEREFKFVKFIMESASVLTRVIVHSDRKSEREDLEMLKKLSSYPRISTKCRLFFVDFTAKGR